MNRKAHAVKEEALKAELVKYIKPLALEKEPAHVADLNFLNISEMKTTGKKPERWLYAKSEK